jgi:hypothetical protein
MRSRNEAMTHDRLQRCREIVEEIYGRICDSADDVDANLRAGEMAVSLRAFVEAERRAAYEDAVKIAMAYKTDSLTTSCGIAAKIRKRIAELKKETL